MLRVLLREWPPLAGEMASVAWNTGSLPVSQSGAPGRPPFLPGSVIPLSDIPQPFNAREDRKDFSTQQIRQGCGCIV